MLWFIGMTMRFLLSYFKGEEWVRPVYTVVWAHVECTGLGKSPVRNRRFPEITGEDNLTVFSYSGRVKSPEWRWQRRRADLRHFEIFRHGPIIIYTRLPAGGTYYPICTFPASSERFDRHFWCLFCLLFTGIRHLPHVLTAPPTKACLLCATPAGIDLYTGPCPMALTECSPLDFRGQSIMTQTLFTSADDPMHSKKLLFVFIWPWVVSRSWSCIMYHDHVSRCLFDHVSRSQGNVADFILQS